MNVGCDTRQVEVNVVDQAHQAHHHSKDCPQQCGRSPVASGIQRHVHRDERQDRARRRESQQEEELEAEQAPAEAQVLDGRAGPDACEPKQEHRELHDAHHRADAAKRKGKQQHHDKGKYSLCSPGDQLAHGRARPDGLLGPGIAVKLAHRSSQHLVLEATAVVQLHLGDGEPLLPLWWLIMPWMMCMCFSVLSA